MNQPRLQPLVGASADTHEHEALGLRGQAKRDPALPVAIEASGSPNAPSLLRSAGALQSGFDLFVPTASLGAVADKLIAAAKSVGGRTCGWNAFEIARVEAGIPRFGVDMDDTNLPLECGIEARAVSYQKGCYIGQEVINRIHSIGHVNRELRRLRLADDLKSLPARGDKLFKDGKEVGHISSAVRSPATQVNVALGYVRREVNESGTALRLRTVDGESPARITEYQAGHEGQ